MLAVLAVTFLTKHSNAEPEICHNKELLEAMRIINRACSQEGCSVEALKELNSTSVNKEKLMGALRNPYLFPVHIFFPANKTDLSEAYDWEIAKKNQLATISYLQAPSDSVIYVIGRASTLGNRKFNQKLSQMRTRSVLDYLQNKLKIKCGGFQAAWLGQDALQLSASDANTLNLNSKDYRNSMQILNQSVELFVFPCKSLLGPQAPSAVATTPAPRPPRPVTTREADILARVASLSVAAKAEGPNGRSFGLVLDEFKKDVETRLLALRIGDPFPANLDLVMKGLNLWFLDPGDKWGEGWWDSSDLTMSSPDYEIVPARQYKCNAYVAEVIYLSLGIVFKIHPSSSHKGKYFPYRAREWRDRGLAIPHFPVVTSPELGDIWSNGSHTGIYLGTYLGKPLIYLSARDDDREVYGVKASVQKPHGVQIKYLPPGGTFRRYTP